MNKILVDGDLVKYHRPTQELNDLGLIPKELYQVSTHNGALIIHTEYHGGTVEIVDVRGKLTEYSENFTKHSCPVVLPVGIVK
jgi:hypothetical protein